MILSRSRPSLLALTVLAGVGSAVPAAYGQDAGQVVHVSDRCEIYGPGLVELGNGTCARVIINGHVHVDAGTRAANAGSWTTGGTSSAAMRTDGLGMLPGAADARHLRVGADPYAR